MGAKVVRPALRSHCAAVVMEAIKAFALLIAMLVLTIYEELLGVDDEGDENSCEMAG
jgi:hypothetical protein